MTQKQFINAMNFIKKEINEGMRVIKTTVQEEEFKQAIFKEMQERFDLGLYEEISSQTFNIVRKRPKIIFIEGADGCGKDTLIDNIDKELKGTDKTYFMFDTLSDIGAGLEAREILKYGYEPMSIDHKQLIYLFLSEQYDALRRVKMHLDTYGADYIILNRSPISTLVYAMVDASCLSKPEKMDDNTIQFLEMIEDAAWDIFDEYNKLGETYTVYLNVDANTAFHRVCKRNAARDKIETEERIERSIAHYYSYLKNLASDNYAGVPPRTQNVICLDATKSPKIVCKNFMDKLILNETRRPSSKGKRNVKSSKSRVRPSNM